MEVKGWHDSMQTFERQVAGGFKRCNVSERRANFAVDENVSVACLRTEPGGKIDHRPVIDNSLRLAEDKARRNLG
jgi:hypothetical protein